MLANQIDASRRAGDQVWRAAIGVRKTLAHAGDKVDHRASL
jgi:hypothetical protein